MYLWLQVNVISGLRKKKQQTDMGLMGLIKVWVLIGFGSSLTGFGSSSIEFQLFVSMKLSLFRSGVDAGG